MAGPLWLVTSHQRPVTSGQLTNFFEFLSAGLLQGTFPFAVTRNPT